MDSRPAKDNVLPIDRPPKELSDLELARRLVELLEMRQIEADEREAAETRARQLREKEDELNEEIVAIKRKLGDTAKRGRGSRPTRAAGSTTSRGRLTPIVMGVLETASKEGAELTPADVIKRMGIEDAGEKQAVRNPLLYQVSLGTLSRRRLQVREGKGPTGHTYRLAK